MLSSLLSFFFLYVGPGMGGGFIAVIVGIVISFFLTLFAILWYPFKRLIRYFKNKNK